MEITWLQDRISPPPQTPFWASAICAYEYVFLIFVGIEEIPSFLSVFFLFPLVIGWLDSLLSYGCILSFHLIKFLLLLRKRLLDDTFSHCCFIYVLIIPFPISTVAACVCISLSTYIQLYTNIYTLIISFKFHQITATLMTLTYMHYLQQIPSQPFCKRSFLTTHCY